MASALSHTVYRIGWLVARGVWYVALSGIKGQLEQRVGFRSGLFAYEVTVIVEGLDI